MRNQEGILIVFESVVVVEDSFVHFEDSHMFVVMKIVMILGLCVDFIVDFVVDVDLERGFVVHDNEFAGHGPVAFLVVVAVVEVVVATDNIDYYVVVVVADDNVDYCVVFVVEVVVAADNIDYYIVVVLVVVVDNVDYCIVVVVQVVVVEVVVADNIDYCVVIVVADGLDDSIVVVGDGVLDIVVYDADFDVGFGPAVVIAVVGNTAAADCSLIVVVSLDGSFLGHHRLNSDLPIALLFFLVSDTCFCPDLFVDFDVPAADFVIASDYHY